MTRNEPPSSSRRPVPSARENAARHNSLGKAVTEEGEIVTAVQVEQRILALSDELEELTNGLIERAEIAAAAEVAYRVAYAQQRLFARDEPGHGPKGRTTNDEADDHAIRACADLLLDRLIKEASYGAQRDSMFTKRAQIEALRTIAANIRGQT